MLHHGPRRVGDEGTYDNRPNDPEYFKSSYQVKAKQPVAWEYCGTLVSDKSNSSKHSKTKTCISDRS